MSDVSDELRFFGTQEGHTAYVPVTMTRRTDGGVSIQFGITKPVLVSADAVRAIISLLREDRR